MHHLSHLPPFDDDDLLNVIIETPKGSRNKFTFDPAGGFFMLGGVLPSGAVFPYDFGFVPGTLGEDGDPLDVLLLMDEPAFPGCVVKARLLGVIEAEQEEKDGAVQRNDRLIAVAKKSHVHAELESLDDLSERLLDEIEHFFTSYNDMKGRAFTPVRRGGPKRARRLVKESARSGGSA
ncbi:MAG TPA: inorganic diphosphatase [Gemmatimonadaceae bacterium]|nr:inorganic diphosphatase [Gemmatimonadaceae bacterium]